MDFFLYGLKYLVTVCNKIYSMLYHFFYQKEIIFNTCENPLKSFKYIYIATFVVFVYLIFFSFYIFKSFFKSL